VVWREEEDLEAAERASRQALDLAPALAEAHTARGFALSLSRRYDGAEREFEEAIRINPNSFDAYYYFARSSFARGDIERSADLFRAAADVRQEDFQSPTLLAQSLRMLGHAEEAHAANQEGIKRAERVLALNPVDVRALSLGSLALFMDGQVERAMDWSRKSLELYPDDMSTLVCATCLRAQAGQKEEAIDTFERLVALGWGKRDWVEHDPDYHSLRDDPRFQRLLARLK
jgi:tetratricopeptide (TPR) repeat protein